MSGVVQSLWRHWDDDKKKAIVFDDTSISFGSFKLRLLKSVAWLRSLGLASGDVVALQMEKSPPFLELILAGISMGCTVLPLNHRFTKDEVTYFLSDAEAKLAILPLKNKCLNFRCPVVDVRDVCSRLNMEPESHLPASPAGDECALLLYTSGTTGRSKGAVISHRNLLATIEGLHQAWHWTNADVLLHVLPIFHVHGLIVAQFGALRANATSIWLKAFSPQKAESAISREGVTVMMAVPTLYHRILASNCFHRAAVAGIRLFTSGSAPLSVSAHEAFKTRTGHVILERYGMTEVGIVLSNPYAGERRPGAVGFPVSGAKIRIMNPETLIEQPSGHPGEIWIKGPSVIVGYLRRPIQTAETIVNGWLRSGDLGVLDHDGYIRIVGRLKDMIISGGENVYPREVEAILLSFPGVDQAAVVGLPDPEWGEKVVAAVMSKQSLSISKLMEACKQRLAPWKRPKEIIQVDDFPRNAMGKIQKSIMRKSWPLQMS